MFVLEAPGEATMAPQWGSCTCWRRALTPGRAVAAISIAPARFLRVSPASAFGL